MRKVSAAKISNTFGIDIELVPFIKKLYLDVYEMGSSPELIVKILEPLIYPKIDTHVIDLGCGKGAVSLSIADKLNFNVTGTDIYPPFIEEAKRRAVDMNVARYCLFGVEDFELTLHKIRDYNIAVGASIAGYFGGIEKTCDWLRKMVSVGEYVVIEDGYINENSKFKETGWGHYRSYEETIALLDPHRKIIRDEIKKDSDAIIETNERYISSLEQGADRIITQRPDLAPKLNSYIEKQREYSKIMNENIKGAIWLIQKI